MGTECKGFLAEPHSGAGFLLCSECGRSWTFEQLETECPCGHQKNDHDSGWCYGEGDCTHSCR